MEKKRVRVWTPEQLERRRAYDRARGKVRVFSEEEKANRKARSKAWAAANPEKIKLASEKRGRLVVSEYGKTWYQKNKEKKNAQTAAWRAANPNRDSELASARYIRNKECINAKNSAWKKANPEARSKHRINRRAAEIQRTTAWGLELTDLVTCEASDLVRLRVIYTGFKWHVDHVIPLQGRSVSGLHVWNNLSVIPAVHNMRKNNRFKVE